MPKNADQSSRPTTYLGLAVGVLSVSTGAIFIRYAQIEAPSLTIAAYRMSIAFAVFVVPTGVFWRDDLRAILTRDWWLALVAGVFLAAHFATWIYSLEYTSVAMSVVMVNTAPLWVALFNPLFTSDRISKATAGAAILSIVGALVMGYGVMGNQAIGIGPTSNTPNNTFGMLLATMGGIGLAGYLLAGRVLRSRHPLGAYVTVCYGFAAMMLWSTVLITNQQCVGFSSTTWWSLIGVALVSQVLGHSLNNWVLRFLSSSLVAVALLGEPVFSSMFAYFLFGESLSVAHIVGALLVLFGIYVAVRAERESPPSRC